MPAGKKFPGDLKCEAFATKQEHEAGYVFINGGWSNQLDVIARLDEHGTDRLEQPAHKVKADAWSQWDVVRAGNNIYWFKAGKLLMHYPDANPIEGPFFGFNNWESRSPRFSAHLPRHSKPYSLAACCKVHLYPPPPPWRGP